MNDGKLAAQIAEALAEDQATWRAYNALRKALTAARQRILVLEEQLANEMELRKIAGETGGEAEDAAAAAEDELRAAHLRAEEAERKADRWRRR